MDSNKKTDIYHILPPLTSLSFFQNHEKVAQNCHFWLLMSVVKKIFTNVDTVKLGGNDCSKPDDSVIKVPTPHKGLDNVCRHL